MFTVDVFKDVKMDKFRCAKLVLDSLHFFNDIVMNRMSVAICSILGKVINLLIDINYKDLRNCMIFVKLNLFTRTCVVLKWLYLNLMSSSF